MQHNNHDYDILIIITGVFKPKWPVIAVDLSIFYLQFIGADYKIMNSKINIGFH